MLLNDEFGWVDSRETGGYTSVAVRELDVKCSLRMRNHDSWGWAASDNCNRPATSAVEMPDGSRMWRCTKHEGVRSMQTGPIWETVRVRDDG